MMFTNHVLSLKEKQMVRQQRTDWHKTIPKVVRRVPHKIKRKVPASMEMMRMQTKKEYLEKKFFSAHVQQIPRFVDELMSNNTNDQLNGITKIWMILSETTDPPFDEVVREGVIPVLVSFLNRTDTPELQRYAISVLNEIILHGQNHARAAIDNGVIHALVQLLNSRESSMIFKLYAGTFIGNLSQSSLASRDHILDNLPSLRISSYLGLEYMDSTVSWILYNLCRTPPPADHVQKILPLLTILRRVINSPYFTTAPNVDACWALCFISEYSQDMVHAIIGADDIVPQLVRTEKSYVCLEPILRILANIAIANTFETEMATRTQILPFLHNILTRNDNKYYTIDIEHACWIISKITNGTTDQINDLFDANIISQLLRIWINNTYDIQQEIAWAVSNAVLKGSKHQIEMLVNEGCVNVLCGNLCNHQDQKLIVLNCLQALQIVLKLGEGIEMADGGCFYGQLVAICGGWDKIKYLETCKNEDISGMSKVVLNRHWVIEYDEIYTRV